jgi:hypothetical protein
MGKTYHQQNLCDTFEEYVGKEGWLEKKGSSRHNWKKRWFVLKGSFLYYYDSEPSTPSSTRGGSGSYKDCGPIGGGSDRRWRKAAPKEKGVISLTNCTVLEIEHHTRPFCFEIAHAERERTYELSCAGAEEMNEWMVGVATAAMGPVDAPMSIASFYERLGVEDNSDMKDVTRAFRKLAMKNHPDKGGDLNDWKVITDAYKVIKLYKEQCKEEAEDFESYKVAMARGGCGLGLSLEDYGDPPLNRVKVTAVVRGKPAHQTGQITEQDILIEIDGHDVRGIPFDTVLKLLRGVGRPNIEMAFLRSKPLALEASKEMEKDLKEYKEALMPPPLRHDCEVQIGDTSGVPSAPHPSWADQLSDRQSTKLHPRLHDGMRVRTECPNVVTPAVQVMAIDSASEQPTAMTAVPYAVPAEGDAIPVAVPVAVVVGVVGVDTEAAYVSSPPIKPMCSNKPVGSWSELEVAGWLESIGEAYHQYGQAFESNGITGGELVSEVY